MAKLKELLERRAEIEREIETARRTERAEAIAKVKALMSEYDLSIPDLSSRVTPKSSGGGPRAGTKVPAKFRNQATGDSWSGRGLQPKWLKAALASGRKIEDFAV